MGHLKDLSKDGSKGHVLAKMSKSCIEVLSHFFVPSMLSRPSPHTAAPR